MQIGAQPRPYRLAEPYHDEEVIDTSVAGTTVITYKLAGVTVGTKTIVVDGTTTTITVV